MSRPCLALIVLTGILAAVAACNGGDSGFVESPTPTAAPAADVSPPAQSSLVVTDELINAGHDIFVGGGGCSACHAIPGVAQGVLGPDLAGIATVAAGRIPGYTAEQYIRESIVDSCAYTVPETDCVLMQNVMNGIHLSDGDVDALVAFLLQQR